MNVKKEGELRVRKGESIYGPMTRADFDRLLASRRFSLADFVSVWGGPWTEVIQFLAPAEAAGERSESAPLRVLRGDYIVGSLTQEQVAQLRAEDRIADEDLVCALGGPWMSVADFLSPPRPPEPPVETPLEAEPEPDYEPEAEFVPLTWYRAYAGEIDEQLIDQWFVRVRGIHSAPLSKQQVRQLVAAEEINDQALARHCTWPEKTWKPIYAIPELA